MRKLRVRVLVPLGFATVCLGCLSIRSNGAAIGTSHGIENPEPFGSKESRAVIFIPGLKGSGLESESSIYWITFLQSLFGRPSLALKNDQIRSATDTLHATEVLEGLDLVFGLFHLAIYSDWLDTLRRDIAPNTKVVTLPYDWRMANREVAVTLASTVERLKSEGVTDVSVVAHSMGGLGLAYYLRYGDAPMADAVENWMGARELSAVVFVGTPFGGTMRVFRDMVTQQDDSADKSILTREELFSFDSIFELLPVRGSAKLVDGYQQTDISSMVWDAAAWKSRKLGPYAAAPQTVEFDRGVDDRLKRAEAFSNLVRASNDAGSPPIDQASLRIQSVVGYGLATMKDCVLRESDVDHPVTCEPHSECPECNQPMLKSGDGVVHSRAADLPKAYEQIAKEFSLVAVPGEHLGMLSEPVVQKRIVEFLNKERSQPGKPKNTS